MTSTDLRATLEEHARVWSQRPLLRRLYHEWFARVADNVAQVPGSTVELGCGLSQLRTVLPEVVETDVEPTPWADAAVDAADLPYNDASLANLILIDVFHHLPDPARFLDEARRALRTGGRVVLLEPYCSPASTLAYRRLHHEDVDLRVDPFGPQARLETAPLEGNLALTTLAFFRHADEYGRRWPELRIAKQERFSFLLYPLSGGYSLRSFAPSASYRPLVAVERAVSPLAALLAFRCLVVLERT